MRMQPPRSFTTLLMAVALGLLAVTTGCISKNVRSGLSAYDGKRYDDAVDYLAKGVREERAKGWYNPKRWCRKRRMYVRAQVTYPVARTRASDVHADAALKYHRQRDNQQAKDECKTSRDLSPTGENWVCYLLSGGMGEREDRAIKDMRRVRGELMPAGRLDEALFVLDFLVDLEKVFTELPELHRKCSKSSVDAHATKAKEQFAAADYAAAVSESTTASRRAPNQGVLAVRRRQAVAHHRAAEACRHASGLMKSADFAAAHATYGTALGWVKDFGPALAGHTAARDKWVGRMLEKAAAGEAKSDKPSLLEARDLLARCGRLHPGHPEVTARLPVVRRRLALLYAKEAEAMLARSDGSRIATAWLAARRAHECDPNAEGVADLLSKTELMMKARCSDFVCVKGDGDGEYVRRLCEELGRRVRESAISNVQLGVGEENPALERMKSEAAKLQPGLRVLWRTSDVAFKVRRLRADKRVEGPTRDLSSRELVGYDAVPNPLRTRATRALTAAVAKLAELQGQHAGARGDLEAAKISKFKAQTIFDVADAAYSRFSGLWQGHLSRQNLYARRALGGGADAEGRNAGAMEPVVRDWKTKRDVLYEALKRQRDTLGTSSAKLQSVTQSLRSVEGRVFGYRRVCDFESPEIQRPKYARYAVAERRMACEGNLDIDAVVRLTGGAQGPRALRPLTVRLAEKRRARVVTGAKVADADGRVNAPDPLPSEALLKNDMEQHGISESLKVVISYLAERHQLHFDRAEEAAKRGDSAGALEDYAIYVYVDGDRHGARCTRATEFINTRLKASLAARQ